MEPSSTTNSDTANTIDAAQSPHSLPEANGPNVECAFGQTQPRAPSASVTFPDALASQTPSGTLRAQRRQLSRRSGASLSPLRIPQSPHSLPPSSARLVSDPPNSMNPPLATESEAAAPGTSPPTALTFLQFDTMDPSYLPVHQQPLSPSTRNPFSYLARRLGGRSKPERPPRLGPSMTISGGLLHDGSTHPYLQFQATGIEDEPLRRYSTTAVNVPKATPARPLRAADDARSTMTTGGCTYSSRHGPWRRTSRSRRRSISATTTGLPGPPDDLALQPYELAIETVGLFHDPLFGLPSLDAATAAQQGYSSDSTASSSDSDPSGRHDARSHRTAHAQSSDSESSVSSRSSRVIPPPKSHPLPTDPAYRRLSIFARPNPHTAPAAITAHGRPTRLAEALAIRSPWKRGLFLLIEDPSSSPWALALTTFISVMIVFSAVVSVVETVPHLLMSYATLWFVLESVLVGIFTVEFLLRLLAHSDNWRQLLRHMTSFLTLVDMAAIIPYYVELGVARADAFDFRFTIVRIFRLFRLFSVFKYSSLLQLSVEVLLIAMRRSMEALIVLGLFIVLALLIFGTLLYYIERGTYDPTAAQFTDVLGNKSGFDSIPAALWFSIAALTTTGFGDVAPKTVGGKAMAFPLMMTGILLISIPSIIVGREFTVVWQAMKLRRRREAQLAQQRAQQAQRREHRRRRHALAEKATQWDDAKPDAAKATEHSGQGDWATPDQKPNAPLPPDVQVIDMSATNLPRPRNPNDISANHTLINASVLSDTSQTGLPLASSLPPARQKMGPRARAKKQPSTDQMDLERSNTVDLRRCSFDDNFMVMAHGFRRVKLDKVKKHRRGKSRRLFGRGADGTRDRASDSNDDGAETPQVRRRAITSVHTKSHDLGHDHLQQTPPHVTLTSNMDHSGSDSSLGLGDTSSAITTDPDQSAHSDSGSSFSGSDDHGCCLDSTAQDTLDALPKALADLAQMLQSLQAQQQSLQQSLQTMAQRVDRVDPCGRIAAQTNRPAPLDSLSTPGMARSRSSTVGGRFKAL
ncbi:hypothetical protein H4R34_001419 [Dimargaris verticillata]|uniref:Ion transport domain-containing protein n=1 Tax=Dimargaris verticillata TaxID=2761393 RepID=A0A9W8BA13_9FUNG|nr:hypothetical protein H4R34_001419 [Dimargaris verticillata]